MTVHQLLLLSVFSVQLAEVLLCMTELAKVVNFIKFVNEISLFKAVDVSPILDSLFDRLKILA